MESVAETNSKLVLYTQPTVTIRRSVVFVQDGISVGHVDAQYDFGNLAPELHELALLLISPQRTILLPLSQAAAIPEHTLNPETFWTRIKGMLHG